MPRRTIPISDAAIQRCSGGIEAARGVNVGEKATVMMAECRFLYSRPACRDAWDASGGPGTVIRVVRSCRDAYCSDLPQPGPGLCHAPQADDDALRGGWSELNDAIMKYEHGEPTGWKRELFATYARLQRLMIVGVGVKLPPA